MRGVQGELRVTAAKPKRKARLKTRAIIPKALGNLTPQLAGAIYSDLHAATESGGYEWYDGDKTKLAAHRAYELGTNLVELALSEFADQLRPSRRSRSRR